MNRHVDIYMPAHVLGRGRLRVAAPSFGLSRSDAERALSDMFDATQQWREMAASNGVTNKEMTLMADTFDGLRPPRRAV